MTPTPPTPEARAREKAEEIWLDITDIEESYGPDPIPIITQALLEERDAARRELQAELDNSYTMRRLKAFGYELDCLLKISKEWIQKEESRKNEKGKAGWWKRFLR